MTRKATNTKKKPAAQSTRKAQPAPKPKAAAKPTRKPRVEKTKVKGQDPRPYLAGAQPGIWASNHFEEANQVKGWQFVAIRTLARMCSQGECAVHRVRDIESGKRKLGIIERRIAKARHIADPIVRSYRLERLEADRERWRNQVYEKTAPDSVRPDREPAKPSHPLMKLLKRWNPEWSGVTGVFATVQQIAATGVALIWAVRNGLNEPVELYVIPTGLCQPRMPSDEFPRGSYWITPISTWGIQPQEVWGVGALGQALLTGAEVDARDVKKICWPHPIYLSDGLAPLSAGSVWVDLGNEMDRSSWYKFQNAERPGMLFKRMPDANPSPEDIAQFREDLRADSAGAPNTGKHLLVPPGIEPMDWSRDNVEMDYANSRPQVRDMNLALHGVTPIACGISEAQAYSAFWASIKQTTELAVQPLLGLIGGELTEFLGHAFGGHHEIVYNAPAIDDPQTFETRLNTDIKAGNVLKVDEYRALRGLPPLGGSDGEAFVGVRTTVNDKSEDIKMSDDKETKAEEQTDGKADDKGPSIRSPFRDAPPGRQDRNGKQYHRPSRN